MAMRNADAQSSTAPASSALARQIGGSPRFVNEHELPRIEIELRPKPLLAPLQDVGALLFLCMRGFFECDLVPIEEAPDHGQRKTLAAVGDQPLLDFQQRDVRLTTNETKQIFAMRLNAVRTPIPARRRRGNLAGGLEALQPTHGAGDADPKTLGRRVARQAADHNSLHDTCAKIFG